MISVLVIGKGSYENCKDLAITKEPTAGGEASSMCILKRIGRE